MNILTITLAVLWFGGIGVILVKFKNLILWIKSKPLKKLEDLTEDERKCFHDYIENLYGKDSADVLVELREHTPTITILEAKEVIKKYTQITA